MKIMILQKSSVFSTIHIHKLDSIKEATRRGFRVKAMYFFKGIKANQDVEIIHYTEPNKMQKIRLYFSGNCRVYSNEPVWLKHFIVKNHYSGSLDDASFDIVRFY